MLKLKEIFDEVVDLGIVETQTEFSEFCGMKPSWYSSSVTRDRAITMDVLYRMKSILFDIYIETLAAIDVEDDPDEVDALQAGSDALKILCDRIQSEMDRRVSI